MARLKRVGVLALIQKTFFFPFYSPLCSVWPTISPSTSFSKLDNKYTEKVGEEAFLRVDGVWKSAAGVWMVYRSTEVGVSVILKLNCY